MSFTINTHIDFSVIFRGEMMINLDLHIHSKASAYKEGSGIVDESTIENAETLMEKLQNSKVGLFSVTDHNRFWPELYIRLDELIKSGNYPDVKGLLAGVEFDVQIDPEMGKCHIISIFNTHNDPTNYEIIKNCIEAQLLKGKADAYSQKDFEELLRSIGLEVILIACQRNSLEEHHGKHRSLSETTMNPEELIMSGYINALEFQRPNVEGILKNNLKDFPKQVLMVTGSDCHDWRYYPNHDSQHGNPQFVHPKARIEPTFKGLLMAITSPETRINIPDSLNTEYFSSISINDEDIPLVNGINAIIGENGAGKSTLLKVIHGDNKDAYVKKLISANKLKCQTIDNDKQVYIEQGDIVHKFENDLLFPEENFDSIKHEEFENQYTRFADELYKYIRSSIDRANALMQLPKLNLAYDDIASKESYFITIEESFGELTNGHKDKVDQLHKIITMIDSLLEDDYYNQYASSINESKRLLESVYEAINNDYLILENEITIKNTIKSALMNYISNVERDMTSQEKLSTEHRKRKAKFAETIITAIDKTNRKALFPELPKILSGFSSNPVNGFLFNSQAEYHDRDVLDEFLGFMFNKGYCSLDAIKNIGDLNTFSQAVRGCGSQDKIIDKWSDNLKKFFDKMCCCKNYIVDPSKGDEELGSTLGELSLAYYKYEVFHGDNKNIYLIDQPEDHISNNNISATLLSLFNSLRNNHQLILVTHNPLLVVNLDVDQVIFLKKKGKYDIEAVYGCLEQEGEGRDILEIVANNMDGGKDSIEKRLRVYG